MDDSVQPDGLQQLLAERLAAIFEALWGDGLPPGPTPWTRVATDAVVLLGEWR